MKTSVPNWRLKRQLIEHGRPSVQFRHRRPAAPPARRDVLSEYDLKLIREGKHTIMSAGGRILTIPRHNPINSFTMGGIARDAGLTPEQFRELL